jgi:hypothetical protein
MLHAMFDSMTSSELRDMMERAVSFFATRSPSPASRCGYRDLAQLLKST